MNGKDLASIPTEIWRGGNPAPLPVFLVPTALLSNLWYFQCSEITFKVNMPFFVHSHKKLIGLHKNLSNFATYP